MKFGTLLTSILYVLGVGGVIAAEATPLFRDASQPLELRLDDLTSRLTLEEKTVLPNHRGPTVERFNIRSDQWNHRLNGVMWDRPTTLFPICLAMSATWDTDLVHEVATVLSDEVRAIYNGWHPDPNALGEPKGLIYRAPVINIARGKPEERYNSRPQMLEPVVWTDGWPQVGVEADGDGTGEVVWEQKKPIAGFPIAAPATDDDFCQSRRGWQWMWCLNPKMDRWSLREHPGFLRLKACVSLPTADHGSIKNLPNEIGQLLLDKHTNVMTAKLDFSDMMAAQEGGQHISSCDNNIIGVKQDDRGEMSLFFKSNTGTDQAMIVTSGSPNSVNNKHHPS